MNLKYLIREKLWKQYCKINNSGNDDPNTNGEYFNLERILKQTGPGCTLIDLGGHEGAWSGKALQIQPKSSIFIFEPLPELQKHIESRFRGDQRITLINGAAAGEDGEIEIFLDTQSTYERLSAGRPGGKTIKSRSYGMNQFIRDNGLQSVYYMKMDIEGHELNVLSGLSDQIRKGFFNYVQFEYGGCNIDSRTYLLDFFRLFETGPYRMARIHPRGLEYVPVYNQKFEDFQYSNWLAVKAT